MKQLFDFDDVLIEPKILSGISSRKELTTKYENIGYPLMTAPMDTVISEDNIQLFKNLGITPILPRIKNPLDSYYSFDHFLSYGIDDFERIFLKNTIDVTENMKLYALIDLANGHMLKLYDISKQVKEKYGNSLVLMIGNIANPKTFEEYCKIGVDYCRIGIGNGDGCLTTVQTGVGYSLPNLIQDCYEIKNYHGYTTKIVADGGFKKYADIIKGLGMGADYIMLGSIFNKALESAGETTRKIVTNYDEISYEVVDQYSNFAQRLYNIDETLYKTFRGMSTKDVQKKWGNEELKTSEGIVKTQKVEYTLKGWIDNFDSYLRTAMSYTGKKNLPQFIGGVNFNLITQKVFNRFNK